MASEGHAYQKNEKVLYSGVECLVVDVLPVSIPRKGVLLELRTSNGEIIPLVNAEEVYKKEIPEKPDLRVVK